ncbi:MAG: hypothetical protein HYZ28_25140 [Myxococcales bacterium]|nr:hypothetical protein [Myxococcales bacterium]
MRAVFLVAVLAGASGLAAEANGYLAARAQTTRVRALGLIPTDELPQQSFLLEVNAQVRHSLAERSFVYGDLSLVGQLASDYRGADREGSEVTLPPRDVRSSHPRVSLNELYLSHEVRPELTLLAGKKRVVWGSGLAFNPTDILNPAKDPTDPTLQRAGAYMLLVEVPLETLAFSFLASPAVLEQDAGIPFRMLTYPEWDPKDSQYHYQLAARGYALVADADVNLMLFFGNRYQDDFERKLRFGASFSKVYFTDYELHLELLAQSGSSRDRVEGRCVRDAFSVLGCLAEGTPVVSKPLLEEKTILPKALVGGRRMFADDSLLSLEYLYQADGYTHEEQQALVDALDLLRQARRLGLPIRGFALPGAGAAEGVPQRFSFEPLGRHYLFATYQKPKIRDDFTFAATGIVSLEDLSGLLAPSLSWSAKDWLTLTVAAFASWPGPSGLGTEIRSTGERASEYSLLPLRYRALFEARAFY